ncbi:aspartic proteinase CDR1-like [Quercus robur]|uniref:aspartic proteinase CDR1-like n=1 Tax=Quercus robur TaxID=38942 RepID=UPI002161CC46|nr:aspartic proteinase CDR1-like [Quercus robur]
MASGVIFHPCFLLSYYLIGLLVTAHNVPQAQLIPYQGQHLMKASIGTPPVDIYGVADTASNLVWTPCVPCNDYCFKQIHPLFDPKKSSTYSEIYCHSEKCQVWDDSHCSPQNSCIYSIGYVSGLSQGVLAKEKATITSTSGQAVSFDIALGCGHNNTLDSDVQATIGLGSGPLSFVSQIGSKRFSYCLLPFGTESTDPSITSKISFGNGSEVVGDGVVSTPIVDRESGHEYYVTLEGISVGDTYVPFNSSGKVSKGNMLIDSGSPALSLPPDFYDRLEVEVKKQISIDPIKNDTLLGTRLCYRTEITNENGPILTVHFEGADVELKPIQTFNRPIKRFEYYCFGITNIGGTDNEFSDSTGVYGNYVQANFLIGYDLETRIVSFKPTDCTKL